MLDVKIELQEIKEDSESGAAATAAAPSKRRLWLIAALAGSAVFVGGLTLWRLGRNSGTEPAPMRVVPLTTLEGVERLPTFSPDGSQVAFYGQSGKDDNWGDIYITGVGSPEVRRVTTDPAWDGSPSWSPDGQRIAFLSNRPRGKEGAGIYLVSPLGGTELKLTEFPLLPERIDWTPDGKNLVVAKGPTPNDDTTGLYLISLSGARPRALTREKSPAFHLSPAFSPEGRRVAYVACPEPESAGCHVFLVELDQNFVPKAPPRRLTTQAGTIRSLTWSRDGQSVIYDQAVSWEDLFYLWRVSAQGGQSQRIEAAGVGARSPASARSRDRLAFAREFSDHDIYSFEIGKTPRALLVSSLSEGQPQFSPDGRRIAFSSARSAEVPEIWVSAADGSGAYQLTRGPGRCQSEPHWSPDGRALAYDSLSDDGYWHVWRIDANGGTPRQLTSDLGNQGVPSWSRDGRWIYFSATAGTQHDIWRIPAGGGSRERLTRGGSGWMGSESPDGKSILYKRNDGPGPLLAAPLAGGPPQEVAPCVKGGRGFAATQRGFTLSRAIPRTTHRFEWWNHTRVARD